MGNVQNSLNSKYKITLNSTQSAGAVEYTNYTSAIDAGALGKAERSFIAIAPRSALAWSGELNRTKLHTYAKLNCLN